MNRWVKFSIAVMAATVAGASHASAQSANINVTANVFQAITVAAGTNLAFGNVFPGVNKTILATDPGAGRWDATGQASQNVNMTFTLPTNLVNGGNNLAVGTWTGCRDSDNTVAGCTAFTPSASATAATFGASGILTVWLGATVAPTAAQAAGSYTATATLTLAYF